MVTEVSRLVTLLYGVLGPRHLAYLTGVEKYVEFDEWLKGGRSPTTIQRQILEETWDIVREFPPGIRDLRQWLKSPSEDLLGKSPFEAIQEGSFEKVKLAAKSHLKKIKSPSA